MRAQLRIVSGSLRGRKLTVNVQPKLRPTPDMVREALFSILGNAVPDRPFFDVFAGTGVVGLEAISRGSSHVTLVERDFRVAAEIDHHLKEFGVADEATLVRADVYRWAERWEPPAEPVNVFLSPPFGDFTNRPAEFVALVRRVMEKVAEGSVVVVQGERGAIEEEDNVFADWDVRHYGRNELMIWVKGEAEPEGPEDAADDDAGT
jgi:16S rRNA (guanine966-N2)-methyltransferase